MITISLNYFIIINAFFLDIDVIRIRVIEAIFIIMMWFKSLYYLSLVGEIAPLIDIIFVIFSDIKYFMVIFIIALFAFINAFYIIGRNQKELGTEGVGYATWLDSAHHVYTSSLGEFDTGTYLVDSMSPVLIILFLMLSFFMCIHLLNMLIAIMGESFSQNHEIGESKKRMSQLSFVVDNWWLNPIPEKERVIYIVGGFAIDQINDDNERFNKISQKIDNLAVV